MASRILFYRFEALWQLTNHLKSPLVWKIYRTETVQFTHGTDDHNLWLIKIPQLVITIKLNNVDMAQYEQGMSKECQNT